MKICCPTCKKILGVLRILLGAGMLVFGVMKLGASPADQAMIGDAGHKLGLTFFSPELWFWIAVGGEIVAGLFLLLGHWFRIGAILTIVIMVFALNAVGPDPKAITFLVLAVVLLIWGPGKYTICKCKSCCKASCCPGTNCCDKDKKCCTNDGSCCTPDGSCKEHGGCKKEQGKECCGGGNGDQQQVASQQQKEEEQSQEAQQL